MPDIGIKTEFYKEAFPLTEREWKIAEMLAQRKSAKAIANYFGPDTSVASVVHYRVKIYGIFGVQQLNDFIKVWNRLPGVPEKGVVLGKLSRREMEICPYLVQGMRAIDIALLFYPMTPDAIRTNHMNIRRKLGVSTPEELRAAWEEELRAIAQANTDVQKVKQPRASEALEHSPAC